VKKINANVKNNTMRIAVTSSNGEKIDMHFGKAESIYVFELDNGKIKCLEKRSVEKYCSDNPLHAFRPEDFDKVYQAIADCEVLYTEKIGIVPAEKCRSLGIKVKEKKGEIISTIIP
jgi:predicted Fe-Mo cluster-binding NifX family protein